MRKIIILDGLVNSIYEKRGNRNGGGLYCRRDIKKISATLKELQQ